MNEDRSDLLNTSPVCDEIQSDEIQSDEIQSNEIESNEIPDDEIQSDEIQLDLESYPIWNYQKIRSFYGQVISVKDGVAFVLDLTKQ